MSELEKRVNALLHLAVAENPDEVAKVRSEIRSLMQNDVKCISETLANRNAEAVVRQILLELGTPDRLTGHPMLVQAIMLCVEEPKYINNITKGLYPCLAEKFDVNVAGVERAIRNAVELTFDRCDPDVICKYFGNTVNADKGKATNSEFLARLSNVAKMQMRQE